jgi:cytochrome c-type biogenesis protein CcmH/NrfF
VKRNTLLVSAVLLVAIAGRAGAQAAGTSAAPVAQEAATDTALEASTSAVAAQLRCPVCQGVSIQDSPAELAHQMRDLVREQLRTGKSPDQVKAYFVSKYGEWILLQPRASGFNILVYALPALVVLGGLVVIVVAMRRWTKPPENPAS